LNLENLFVLLDFKMLLDSNSSNRKNYLLKLLILFVALCGINCAVVSLKTRQWFTIY